MTSQAHQMQAAPVNGMRSWRLVECCKCGSDNRAFLRICLHCGTLLGTTEEDKIGLTRRVVGPEQQPVLVVYESE